MEKRMGLFTALRSSGVFQEIRGNQQRRERGEQLVKSPWKQENGGTESQVKNVSRRLKHTEKLRTDHCVQQPECR